MVDAAENAFLIFAAEAVSFRRPRGGRSLDHERLGFGEIRDLIMRPLLRRFVHGAACAERAKSGMARMNPSAIGTLSEAFILVSCRSEVSCAEIFPSALHNLRRSAFTLRTSAHET